MALRSERVQSKRRLWISSPQGAWCLESGEDAIISLNWQGETSTVPPGIFEQPETALEHQTLALLHRYFQGETVAFDSLPLQLTGTPFQQAVCKALADIPYGETRSYQWMAERVGRPRATRAVGGALGYNPLPVILPCHRVITSAGGLGGFMSGRGTDALGLKAGLLALEGTTLGVVSPLAVLNKG